MAAEKQVPGGGGGGGSGGGGSAGSGGGRGAGGEENKENERPSAGSICSSEPEYKNHRQKMEKKASKVIAK